MRRADLTALLLLATLGSTTTIVTAQQDDRPETPLEQRMRQMQEELDAVRSDNEQMRLALDELRAQSSDDWLTEQRAEEIRSLVQDVLADADNRASLQGNGLTAGWADHFFLASADGRFKLELDGQFQFRFVYNFRDQPDRHRYGFETPRTRLTFRGHVFSPDIEYLVRTSVTRDTPGLVTGIVEFVDAWARIRLDDQWSVRVGQFKAPFMREELVDSKYQLAVERSLVNDHMSVDRTQGIEFVWAGEDRQLALAFLDAGTDQLGNAGLIATRPAAGGADTALMHDSEFTIATRYEHLLAGTWDQFSDFTSPPGDDFGLMVGVAGFWQKDESGVQNQEQGLPVFFSGRDEREWVAGTADISVEWGGANLFASYTMHYVDTPVDNFTIQGIVVQGGYFIAPRVELFARFEWGQWDFSTNESLADLTLVTGGVNYYIDGHDLKWTTDLGVGISKIETVWASDLAGYRAEVDGAEPQVVFRTQFQLLF